MIRNETALYENGATIWVNNDPIVRGTSMEKEYMSNEIALRVNLLKS